MVDTGSQARQLNSFGERAVMVRVIRVFLVTVGFLAALWSASNFTSFVHRGANDRLATRILAGDVFKDDTIERLLRTIDANRDRSGCDVPALHASAILQLRNLENAIAAKVDGNMPRIATQNAIVASLSCAPADPFLWLVLASIANDQHLGSEAEAFLRLSYQLGPSEGWISIKRNYIAFTMFDQLPADITDRALFEFGHLVSSGIYREAADVFLGPGVAQRQRLLEKLTQTERFRRESFMNELRVRGYDTGSLRSNADREYIFH
jgi:hypothetical protein